VPAFLTVLQLRDEEKRPDGHKYNRGVTPTIVLFAEMVEAHRLANGQSASSVWASTQWDEP
jgi:hypothetical protein